MEMNDKQNKMNKQNQRQDEIDKWYEEFQKNKSPMSNSKTDIQIMELKEEAKKCLDSESIAYQLRQSKSKNSDYSWLQTALKQGTMSDKIAAKVITIQDSPKHNLNHLKALVSQVKVAKHNQCSSLITTLRDLFLLDLLHPESGLLKFEEQDLDKLDTLNMAIDNKNENVPFVSRNKLLSFWYFEDQLKETYERFVSSLATIANDTVDTNRENAVSVMNDLLMGNQEQEHKLLDFLINKIGDPSSKVASKAIYSLNKLLYEHPNMKPTVLKEIEKFLFRSNIGQRAQYYAICLLTQFVLTKEDSKLAASLIDLYFAFFKASLKKGEPDSRMMAAILSGVNRAYPFAEMDSINIKDHIDSVYKVVHTSSFNVNLNALNLLFQVVGNDPSRSDRFYSAFYRKLFDPQIATTNKQAIFLNLLYRALRNDQSVTRLHAFIKRILQILTYFPSNTACAILYVISQVLHSKKLSDKILNCSNEFKTENEIDLTNESNTINTSKKNSDKKIEKNIILSNVIENKKEDNTSVKQDFEIKQESDFKLYDPFGRNPLYSGVINSFYSELVALSNHFHPSVALFANSLIQGKTIEYSGDPLEDLTLIRFLDRFVFKNPKKLEDKKVVKNNDPLAKRTGYIPRGIKSIPVGSSAYLNEKEDNIPVDELFLYQYLKKRHGDKDDIKNKCNDNNDSDYDNDNDSVNSEDFNEMLDNLSKGKDSEDLDIAAELGIIKKTKGKIEDGANKSDDESEGESEISNENSFEDDDNFEDLDDLDFDNMDDDASDIEFSEDDSFTNEFSKRKQSQNSKSNKKYKGLENVFASAEEFSEILENQGRSKFKFAGSTMLSDFDGAGVKQLDWETQRNQKLTGFRKSKKQMFNKRKNKKNFKPYKN